MREAFELLYQRMVEAHDQGRYQQMSYLLGYLQCLRDSNSDTPPEPEWEVYFLAAEVAK